MSIIDDLNAIEADYRRAEALDRRQHRGEHMPSTALQAHLETLTDEREPIRIEIEIALEAETTLRNGAPEQIKSWTADQWRVANGKQREAIDRLLTLWRDGRELQSTTSELLARAEREISTLLACCATYHETLGRMSPTVAEDLYGRWKPIDDVRHPHLSEQD